MAPVISLGNRKIGDGYPCYIIAEAGVNHNGDVEIAKDLITMAKEAGFTFRHDLSSGVRDMLSHWKAYESSGFEINPEMES